MIDQIDIEDAWNEAISKYWKKKLEKDGKV